MQDASITRPPHELNCIAMSKNKLLGMAGYILLVSVATNQAWAAAEATSPIYHFSGIHRHPWFVDVMVYATRAVGSS